MIIGVFSGMFYSCWVVCVVVGVFVIVVICCMVILILLGGICVWVGNVGMFSLVRMVVVYIMFVY